MPRRSMRLKDIWAIRARLQIGNRTRELALLFNPCDRQQIEVM